MKRRDLLKLGVGLALAPGVATLLRAQDAAAAWPAKSVRLIIPFTPGGSTDFQGRILCEWLGRHFGQQFVIDHKPGAGSNIGVAEVARSAPVSMTGIFPNLLVVNNNLPERTVQDLILLLKQQPGKYTFASSGRGTSLHLSGELFKMLTGTDMLHVPYKGGGQVHMNFGNMPTVLAQAKGGKVRAIAVTSAGRWFTAPEIPAIAETVPGFLAMSWHGVAFPAGTQSAIVDKLSAAIRASGARVE